MTAKEIYESVCQIHSQGLQDGGQGTGFFIYHKNKTYIVSNKHVICGNNFQRTQITLFTNVLDNKTQNVFTCTNKFPINDNRILKSDEYDIAIFCVDDVIIDINKKGYILNHYLIQPEDFISVYDQIDYIEDVIFLGYPSGLKDAKTNRPFALCGITSTPIFLTLEGREEFVISAPSYKGNSGSPVFVKINNQYKFIGALSGSLKTNFSVYNINTSNKQYIKQIDGEFDSSLSFCIKANVITSLMQRNEIS